MKIGKNLTFVTVALLSGLSIVTIARAAGMSNEAARKSASMSTPKDQLSLTNRQQKMLWQDIAKQATKEKSPAGFLAKVGAVVPNTLMTYPVPISASNKIPELRRYQYALLDSNRLLIVNPSDNKVADVVMK